ncbi:hypothetical protein F4677DRAFT_448595 [Hypoxylon crocopeplum]|nr:hypothetical protein F4677DRAFT_448595 [Hypoxylon crocopeplum]
MSPATPLILCGQFEEVGKAFKEAAQPDFEVVYFVSSPQAGLSDIPQVLKGEVLTLAFTGGSKVGTGNVALGAPKAVVVGATYDDAWVEALRKELAAAGKPVPILKAELPDKAAAGEAPTPDKGKEAAVRAIRALKKLEGEGKLDGGDDGVYTY